jgi:hypothetical protein
LRGEGHRPGRAGDRHRAVLRWITKYTTMKTLTHLLIVKIWLVPLG